MKVCIVCPPLVVIVPPVEEGDTPSLQSVAYEIITIPVQPAHHTCVPAAPPHPPHPLFAVPAVPAVVLHQFHPPSVPVPHISKYGVTL